MSHFNFSIRSGKQGAAADQIAYITRKGKHGHREDLVFTQYGNLPEWANDNPKTFFDAADRCERKNGAVFRNVKVSLPNVLTLEQNKELSVEIAGVLAPNKPYMLAMHICNSAIESVPNPHMHLLYSDRADDGISRAPEQTFRRYNARNPEKGGRKKDSGGMNSIEIRDDLLKKRQLVADLTNMKLAEYGHLERVDPRALKDQGKQHKPERHLGQRRVRSMTEHEKQQYVEMREERRRSNMH